MTLAETPTDPVELVVKPALVPLVEGAVQPAGTVSSIAPLVMPPLAAVYVKTRVLPVEPASAEVGLTDIVPEPSALLLTLTEGEASAVSVPPVVDFCLVDHVCEPVVVVAVAPGPLLALLP